jgi:hypothetical protein
VGSVAACKRAEAAIEDLLRRYGNGSGSVDGHVLTEKIYVDELDLSYRPDLWHELEDGLPTDIELFVQGLPEDCTERDLWDHLCSMGISERSSCFGGMESQKACAM